MQHTERFRSLRKAALDDILDKKYVSSIWRKIVRSQLRSLEIPDLFDNYDFNYNIEERVSALKASILEGSYTVSTPLIFRVEKKYGVCRHIVIPQPSDALLLQSLIESVAQKILEKQPSKNAFYSRDKHNVKKPHESEDEYGISFREQWKRLQKQIYKFNEEKELLVVTDLTNYYDSISIDELRKVFVSIVETNEVVIDLLFKIIEGISWIPDYLPYSKRGLPTSNIEGIRLLSHSFLFEIDDVIKRKSNNSFARWMDDITVGVDSRKEAISLISSISDMLKSRGLALNLSKTAIFTSENAKHQFQIDANRYLDSIDEIDSKHPDAKTTEAQLLKRFNNHFKDHSAKSWDKVAKRYITAFSRLKSRKLIKKCPDLYLQFPGLRVNLLFYLTNMGYLPTTADAVEEILKEIDLFDDLSLFQISRLLTTWNIPRTPSALNRVLSFEKTIAERSFEQKEPIDFYSLMWFKSKYSSPEELINFLTKYQNLWQTNSFLRRQATICISRTLILKGSRGSGLLSQQGLSGIPSTVSIANQISLFSRIQKLESKVKMYIFPTSEPKFYPLPKFLVVCALLNSEALRQNETVVEGIKKHLTDPTYRHWIRNSYNLKI